MVLTKKDITRAVKQLGHRGAHFQFHDLRNALEVASDDQGHSSQLYNHLKQLLAEGAVEVVPGDARRRNRYYRVKSEERLRNRATWLTAQPSGAARSVDPFISIEGGIQALGERLEHIEAKLNDLLG